MINRLKSCQIAGLELACFVVPADTAHNRITGSNHGGSDDRVNKNAKKNRVLFLMGGLCFDSFSTVHRLREASHNPFRDQVAQSR